MARSVAVEAGENNLYGLEGAPIFRPTEEEFRDPFKYIESIRPQGEKAGICKIIPPKSWKPQFSVDQEVRVVPIVTTSPFLGLVILEVPAAAAAAAGLLMMMMWTVAVEVALWT